MTAERCIPPDEIERVRDLPASAAERVHARSCPRCAALLDAFALYADDTPEPQGSDVRDAERRLTAALAAEIAPAPARRAAPAPADGRSFWQKLFAPPLRPGFAFAAMLAVAALVAVLARGPGPMERSTLRGNSASAIRPDIESLTRDAQGLHARWRAVPEAEAYEVRIYASDLRELLRVGPVNDTRIDIPLQASGVALPTTGGLALRVYALRSGEVIASSEAREIE